MGSRGVGEGGAAALGGGGRAPLEGGGRRTQEGRRRGEATGFAMGGSGEGRRRGERGEKERRRGVNEKCPRGLGFRLRRAWGEDSR